MVIRNWYVILIFDFTKFDFTKLEENLIFMILGIGVDIVSIKRIETLLEKWGRKFKNRVFTKHEIEYCEKKGREMAASFAVRFAAKEAFYKAMGEFQFDGIRWRDVEVRNDFRKKPSFKFYKDTLSLLKKNKIKNVFLSLSHEKEFGIAEVIIEN